MYWGPRTQKGRIAVFLGFMFFVLFVTWLSYTMIRSIPRPTFFSDPIHAVLILGAAASAILGALFGVIATIFNRERSIMTFMTVIVGVVVSYWTLAEIFGH